MFKKCKPANSKFIQFIQYYTPPLRYETHNTVEPLYFQQSTTRVARDKKVNLQRITKIFFFK